jgi:dihydrofolate reductase
MAKLIYSAITSLDGYVADADGNFDWAVPDDEVHRFVNDLERPIGTYLYGRRMYEVMAAWETVETEQFSRVHEFAELWRSADKIVYSTSLPAVATARTSLQRRFEPEAVRRLKAAAERDLSIGGPELAGHALRHGLVDECHLYLNPVVVGAGTPALPDQVRFGLELLDEHRFGNGVVHLHYRLAPDHSPA